MKTISFFFLLIICFTSCESEKSGFEESLETCECLETQKLDLEDQLAVNGLCAIAKSSHRSILDDTYDQDLVQHIDVTCETIRSFGKQLGCEE